MQETKKPHLVRDQPEKPLNLCPRCLEHPRLCDNANGTFSLKCSCGRKTKITMPKIDDLGLQLLCTFWNIKTTRVKWSKVMMGLLNVTDGSFLVYDLRDYAYIESFDTLLDAMTFMERRFNEDIEQRTALFQCNHNSLEFIMISDELWDN